VKTDEKTYIHLSKVITKEIKWHNGK
jgi:hypothetical protein